MVYRLWYLDQRAAKLRGHSGSQLGEIIHTIIDAGVIYFLTLLAVTICFSLQSNGQYVILDMVSYRTGLAHESNLTDIFHFLLDRAYHLHHILHGNYSHRVI